MKLFTKTVCPKCIRVKDALERNGVEYESVNIDHDVDAKNEVVEQGFMATPVVLHEGKYYADVTEIIEIIEGTK